LKASTAAQEMVYHFDTFYYGVATNLNSNLYQEQVMDYGAVSVVAVEETNLHHLHHYAKASLHAQVRVCHSEPSFYEEGTYQGKDQQNWHG
jgi:hypothetical protein